MPSIELTVRQKTTLTILINLYQETDNVVVTTENIAKEANRNPGTIRNQMQELKSHQLVDGIAGPGGGYIPTSTAYEVLDIHKVKNHETIPVKHDGDVTNIIVETIKFTTISHPDICRAKITLRGSIQDFNTGDEITIGPSPVSKLRITGIINAKDNTNRLLLLCVENIVTPNVER